MLPWIWLSIDLAGILIAAPARCCPALVGYFLGTLPLSSAIVTFSTVVYNLMGIDAFLFLKTRGGALAS